MRFDDVFDVLGGIVLVAMATTLVLPNRQTSRVVSAFGNTFARSINAALGRG